MLSPLTTIAPSRRGYLERALRRLESLGHVAPQDEQAVRMLDQPRLNIRKGEDLFQPGAPAIQVILEGWACQLRSLGERRRLIFAFLLPGDVIERPPSPPHPKTYDCKALTPLITMDASAWAANPRIAARLAALQLRAQSRLFDQVVRLGAQPAYDAVAHLLLELYTRQAEVGMADGHRCAFPIGQEQLGEMLGLTDVHVNRTLTRLRKDGHLLIGSGWLAFPRLRDLALQVGYPASPGWPPG